MKQFGAISLALLLHAAFVSAKVWGGFEDGRLDISGSETPSLFGEERLRLHEFIVSGGFEIRLTDVVTADFLSTVDVFYPSVLSRSGEGSLSEEEQVALKEWVEAGGVLIGLVDGGIGFAEPYDTVLGQFNLLSASGSFSGVVESNAEHPLTKDVEQLFFNLGSFFTVHTDTQPDAQVLFVNEENNACVVVLENIGDGNGAVLVIGDSTLIRDEFIIYNDNEQFFENMVSWAHGHSVEYEPVVDEPVVDEPVVDEPVVDEPVVDGPVVDGPVRSPFQTTEFCSDDIQFRDSDRHDCTLYEANQAECEHAEIYANLQGLSAKDSCCICGGGTDFTRDILDALETLQDSLDNVGMAFGLDIESLRTNIAELQAHFDSSVPVHNSIVSSLSNLQTDLDTIGNSLAQGHTDLRDAIVNVETGITSIINFNTDHSGNMADLKQDVSGLQTSITNLQTALQDQITAQNVQISAVQQSLADLNTGLNDKLNGVGSNVGDIKSSIGEINTSLQNAITTRNALIAAVDNLGAQISSFRNFVEEMDSDIDNAHSSQNVLIENIDTTIFNLKNAEESHFGNIANSLTSLESSHQNNFNALIISLDNVKTQITNVNTNLDDLDDDIVLLTTDVAGLNTPLNALDSSVTTVSTKITDFQEAFFLETSVISGNLESVNDTIVAEVRAVGLATEELGSGLASLESSVQNDISVLQSSIMAFQNDVINKVTEQDVEIAAIRQTVEETGRTALQLKDRMHEMNQALSEKLSDQNDRMEDFFATQDAFIQQQISDIGINCDNQNAEIKGAIQAVYNLLQTFVVERNYCLPFGGIADNSKSVCCLASCAKCDDSSVCSTRSGGASGCCVSSITASNDVCDGSGDAPCILTHEELF